MLGWYVVALVLYAVYSSVSAIYCSHLSEGMSIVIVYLTLSDMLASIMYMIPPTDNCSLQGAILCFGTHLRLAFSVVIAVSIHLTYRARKDKFKQKERLSLFLIFIICATSACLPYTTSSYGHTDALCWITITGDNYLSGTLWRVGLFHIPYSIAILYISWVYISIIKNLKKLRYDTFVDGNFADFAIKRLILYPALLIIVWLTGAIKDFILIFNPEFSALFLTCLARGLVVSMGFLNAIIYGFNSEVRDVLYKSCLRKDLKSCNSESVTSSLD